MPKPITFYLLRLLKEGEEPVTLLVLISLDSPVACECDLQAGRKQFIDLRKLNLECKFQFPHQRRRRATDVCVSDHTILWAIEYAESLGQVSEEFERKCLRHDDEGTRNGDC